MMGWAKVAKKRWPSCEIRESEGGGFMDVVLSGELLVAARKRGDGSWQCGQAETHAKYPLSVCQSEGNPLPGEVVESSK